ncbi:MAG: thioredoxin family protein [candidate division KSB1 bacterium]|nr:thioredoxin family protein [candidate division KSB1 bacterium]MDZ7333815.1 thioredoxin family protein [candidate division KSB1 bacterium]MDZ7356058.1 thioredoxin family protein [candidate division KSB1 bacterium]MDZ7400575.1 thioredoxin family protein [candidate division KSB1 bacterium]
MAKQILFDALQNKATERPAWVPFVGCHGGALIGKDATTYLRSGELMAQGVTEAIRRYQPDGIPVTFDLQIEAEALGCELQWAPENPPAVVRHVLSERPLKDLGFIDQNSGRIPEVLKAIRLVKSKAPDVALYGLVTGPFTLSLHLRGTDIFTDMFDNPGAVKEIMAYATEVSKQMARLYIEAGCEVIAIVDPMTSQISPEAFREFVSPFATEFFREVRKWNAFSSFFVCGHAQRNIQAMCETGPDNISIDENIPLDYVKQVCQQYRISFGGNLQLTVVLLMGSEDDARRNALECIDIGGNTGFILAPGCDLPYAVPPRNLEAVAEIVHDPYKRQVARELLAKKKEIIGRMDLADYGQADKVIVDVITLDSEGCAPCQYMVEAVKSIVPLFNGLVIWREHKIKEKESVEFMMGLMVRNIPTICIDGKIKFVSTIPSRQELIQAIQDRINEKFYLKLRQSRNQLLVLTSDDEKSEQTWANVQHAIKELGSTVEVVRLTDPKELERYGVNSAPAVLTVRERLKSVGRVPSVEVIKEWLKDLG